MTALYDQVYREYMDRAQDPAWKLAFEIYLGELVQDNALYHQGQIQAIADSAMLKQVNVAKHAITKRYLTDRLSEIRKNTKKDFQETKWQRDRSGQFARYVGPKPPERSHFDAEGKWRNLGSKATDYHAVVREQIARLPFREQQSANRLMGLLAKPEELDVTVSDADHKADVYTRMTALTHDLENKTRDTRNKQRIQYLVSNPDGYSRIELPDAGTLPSVDWQAGERVQYMTPVGPDHPVTIGGNVLNIGHIAGATNEDASKIGSVAQEIKTTLNSTSWGQKLQSTANVLKIISNDNPLAVQAAAVASLANIIGPDAIRAFQPKLLQLTYRYTGQEAPRGQWSKVAQKGRQETPRGVEPVVAFEQRLAEELGKEVPLRSEYLASLQAGSTPPSKGYILNKEGEVVSEAVGYSDDWYAPFNLRKLPNLKGGSYVRSRAYGGLTTEDIRLAMRTGAKRATVVSNNGTFTIEFQPKALHWGHRFGFGGGIMLRRYAKSLDAIKNNRIARPDEQGGNLALNAEGYAAAMNDLRLKFPYWVSNPTETGLPFLRDTPSTVRSKDRNRSDSEGYVKPLSIRASGARAGWAETGHRELWTDKTGKFAYDEVDKYRLFEDQKLRVMRALGSTAASSSVSSSVSGVRSTWSGSTAVNAGAIRSAPSYPNEEKLNGGQMDAIMHDIRRLLQQAEDKGVSPSTPYRDLTHLSVLKPMLLEADPVGSYTNDKDYQELRNKLAANPDLRKELAEEIGDAFSGNPHLKGVDELLPRLHSETREEDDEEAGARAAAEQYTEADVVPSAAILSSPAIIRYRNKLALQADDNELDDSDRKLAKGALNQFNWYVNRLKEIEKANGNFRFASDAEEAAWKQVNRIVVGRLNDERARESDPGDTGDDGARTTTKPGSHNISIKTNDLLRMEVEDAVADLASTAFEESGGGADAGVGYMQEQVAAVNNAATTLRKKNLISAADKLQNIANGLLTQIQDLEESEEFRRKVDRRNT